MVLGTSASLPEDKHALLCILVYKLNITPHDEMPTYKARLVATIFKQEKGVTSNEIFSLVVKITSCFCVLTLVVGEDKDVVQMNFKTRFLHSDLHKDLYLQQPPNFGIASKEQLVCTLKDFQKFDAFVEF